MGLSADGIAAFGARAARRRAGVFAVTISMGGEDFAGAADVGEAMQAFEDRGGPQEDWALSVEVADTQGMAPELGREVTVSATVTGRLESKTLRIRGIVRHPVNPAVVLGLEPAR